MKGTTIVEWYNPNQALGQAGEPVPKKKRFSIRGRFGSVPGLSKQEMSTEIFSLEGKTALVTGSSTGLGKRMAVALGQAGD